MRREERPEEVHEHAGPAQAQRGLAGGVRRRRRRHARAGREARAPGPGDRDDMLRQARPGAIRTFQLCVPPLPVSL